MTPGAMFFYLLFLQEQIKDIIINSSNPLKSSSKRAFGAEVAMFCVGLVERE
jgi:hypothetical protein